MLGSNITCLISWLPFITARDGTSGIINLQAGESPLLSPVVTGTMSVIPNSPPEIVFNKSSPYSFNASEDNWTTHAFILYATDPNTYHRTNLAIYITYTPAGLNLTLSDGTPIVGSNVLIPSQPGSDGNTTIANVLLKAISGFYGNISFGFKAVDLLSASSQVQKVSIMIDHKNLPPVTHDVNFVIDECTCLYSCGNNTATSYKVVGPATVAASDDSDDDLALYFASTIPTNLISFGLYTPNQFISPLPRTGPFYKSQGVWNFWFQPVCGRHSSNCNYTNLENCSVFATLDFYVQDSQGAKSNISKIYIKVYPVNAPPTSQDRIFIIPEDSELVVWWSPGNQTNDTSIPIWDSSDDPRTVKIISRGPTVSSLGSWLLHDGRRLESAFTEISQNYVRYIPPAGSSSTTFPLSTLGFYAEDLGLSPSADYTIQVFVTPIPHKPKWIGPLNITILEDSQAILPLNSSKDLYTSIDVGVAYITIQSLGQGFYSDCPLGQPCMNITNSTLPYLLRSGHVTYRPLQNEYGSPYSRFNFTLCVTSDPALINDPRNSLNTTYTIHVLAVNDAPILTPQWLPSSGALINHCDEDTYVCVNFTAFDVDSPLVVLTARTLSYFMSYQASMFSCTNGRHSNCTDGQYISTIGQVNKIADAHWRVCFVPAPNWNGILSMDFVVYDEFKSSQTETCVITVYPINDSPSLVALSTFIVNEYYEVKGNGTWLLRGKDPSFVRWTIKDAYASRGDLSNSLEGQTDAITRLSDKRVNETTGNTTSPGLIVINRLYTLLQDIDFFFGYELALEGSLYQSQFVPALALDNNTFCKFPTSTTISCLGVIGPLNAFLYGTGLPLLVDTNVTWAYGVFTVMDLGNIDKWNRPLNASFVILFSMVSGPSSIAGIPTAVIAVLPVVSVAAASFVLGAWVFAGQQAAAQVTGYINMQAVVLGQGAHCSPLYQDSAMTFVNPVPASVPGH
eukprot:TRINITY_DN376_c0_g2_i3.p1 TRINITY_DN376_c0_g2~~TRINITY_DN376_c0_g2_i3.p1  ORF type:complete len:963 (-),score=121.83 TRINITY_DN376_c0_g2_i3:150-3038(-)